MVIFNISRKNMALRLKDEKIKALEKQVSQFLNLQYASYQTNIKSLHLHNCLYIVILFYYLCSLVI